MTYQVFETVPAGAETFSVTPQARSADGRDVRVAPTGHTGCTEVSSPTIVTAEPGRPPLSSCASDISPSKRNCDISASSPTKMAQDLRRQRGEIMRALCVAILILLGAFGLFAQANATLGGTASDATGALVPGVTITAVNVNTGVSLNVVTNETGNYQFASLQPGTYKVSCFSSRLRHKDV